MANLVITPNFIHNLAHCNNGHDLNYNTARIIIRKDGCAQLICRLCRNACARECSKRFRNANPNAYRQFYRDRQVKAKYGITWEERGTLLVEQGGKCANKMCPNTEPGGQWNEWHVDHDHETGKVRGLLCNGCNIALGILDDDPKRILGLAEYVRNN